jgi:hypothetical protein
MPTNSFVLNRESPMIPFSFASFSPPSTKFESSMANRRPLKRPTSTLGLYQTTDFSVGYATGRNIQNSLEYQRNDAARRRDEMSTEQLGSFAWNAMRQTTLSFLPHTATRCVARHLPNPPSMLSFQSILTIIREKYVSAQFSKRNYALN